MTIINLYPAVETPKCSCRATAVVRAPNGRWYCNPCLWSTPRPEGCPYCLRSTPHLRLDGPDDLELRTCLSCKTTYHWADAGHPRVWCDGR